MRKLAIIALTISLFAACSSSYETVRKATISGTITNPKSEVITFRKGDVSETDSLSETGSFEVTFELEEAGEIRFSHGGEYGSLYAHPGDAIILTLDTDEFDETLVFTGDAADINNYLAAMTLLSDSLPTYRDKMMRDEAAFLKVQDSIKELKIGYLNAVSDEEFKALTKEKLFWDTYSERLDYEMSHEYYLELPLDDFSVSDDFYSFLTTLDINDSSKLNNPSFKRYVTGLVRFTTPGILTADSSLSYFEGYLVALDSVISSKPIRDVLIHKLITGSYSYLPEDFKAGLIINWKSGKPNPKLVSEVDELVASWARLNRGQPALDFSYESINGDTLTMADFKGSVVYIDVWATWCGPCIGEHPYMEKLQEEFKDKNVTFVAVSIDDTKEPWIKMVNDKKLGGVHVFAPGAWNSSIINDYMIQGIPRFILIDQEGNIVDATAQRPSGNIDEEIEKLLNPTNEDV